MSSSPPPTKPPRGVKQGKETSGLLMSVIRTLSASETNEQREKERAKLEKDYKKSDARLNELVKDHASEIMEVMQKFSTAGAALTAWGVRCDTAVARLDACRKLLQLRRSDLRRLWADARTQHYALQMLTDIERVVVSERETREAMSAGRVLGAATTLDAALTIAKSTLAHVDALHNTRDHLENKKRELVDLIVKGLSDAVYRGEPDPMSRRPSARRRTTLLLAELTKSEEVTDALLQDVTPEMEASLCEEDSTFDTNVIIYLEALGVLDQLKEATEKFKVQIQSELLSVISDVSTDIVSGREAGDSEQDGNSGTNASDTGVSETGRPLATLLNCLADRFLRTAADNARLLQLWKAALQRHHIPESCLHTQQHYWSAVQQVLQLLLTEYLEIESVTLAAQRATGGSPDAVATELPMADYFAKKRPQRPRTKLFRLTAPAVGGAGGGRACAVRPLVCAPHPAHLHAALPALHRIANTIQSDTDVAECSLRSFITDYVRDGETERLASAARAAIDAAMQEAAAWRERESAHHRLVFTCTSRAWAAVHAAAAASARLGSCGGGAAARACVAALATLATHARHEHARLMPRQYERAAKWLADDDIVRFLQSLPNWKAAISTDPVTEDKLCDQELQQAYEREAEILSASLGDGVITKREIVSEIAKLADMAVMCESMNWLSANIRSLPALMSSVKLSDKLLNDLESAALIFDEISHKCLLFLHLEMRIQCFHYLGQGDGGGSADAGAGRLAHALLSAHEHCAQVLSPRFKQYMMGGLGSMMSAGVMCVGAAGGAALATLRHCLAALQLPGRGLHHALAYTAALDERPEDIIQTIREKGAQFTELQYLNAFKIIAARRGITQADMKVYHKQLSSALGHIGVTV